MGRSAKVHKRTKPQKSSKSTSNTQSTSSASRANTAPKSSQASTAVQSAKKRATLKDKVKPKSGHSEGAEGQHVLGGADYVTLLMGGRRKAAAEALKMPQEKN
ncbi:hypothetical protein SERLA73DRAFT_183427 [Serpula lacrymans var. lacrymans S7.3]|uniref:Uncharacterized protein n=2 Tax=Serpula lacrymans var. lacrymans TaxID=341189 RepID=F8PZV5_SERL3|nr:uncharacterized protein SERLADRAFT_470614 [Serpula lacrymans var. lacrymans S7.9]EGN98427.1 hypothetical protein SERLA73DRAFT_183427 [Serpula lacrymans var. lacrymans S7.3]EGO24009.1 hypothetical protein SERLADRAFT_470614 [Serpula lacrymans var. lacrymans S7.9]